MDAISAVDQQTNNRAHRRRMRSFGRGRVLTTDLIAAPVSLDGHPKAKRVASAVRECVGTKPSCICCHQRPVTAGAFLCGWTAATNNIAVAVICVDCWRDATDAEIEHAATVALREAVPGGKFLD